jgi:hypothetical protein
MTIRAGTIPRNGILLAMNRVDGNTVFPFIILWAPKDAFNCAKQILKIRMLEAKILACHRDS